MLVSRPLAEKRQISAAVRPEAGRCNETGFPASEQELVAVEKAPSAATLRSTSALGTETPAVVGSTTMMMSLAVAAGAVPVWGDHFIGGIWRNYEQRNAVGHGVTWIANLHGQSAGIGDI
jgi:hypothetical protein